MWCAHVFGPELMIYPQPLQKQNVIRIKLCSRCVGNGRVWDFLLSSQRTTWSILMFIKFLVWAIGQFKRICHSETFGARPSERNSVLSRESETTHIFGVRSKIIGVWMGCVAPPSILSCLEPLNFPTFALFRISRMK